MLKVAVVGAGPAGIYAADILSKSDIETSIDLFERLPAPYGLVRYGVAPDHPRIKQIIDALYAVLRRGDIRLLGNVNVGVDISVEDLRARYDAVIFATGSDSDMPLDIPGIDLHGSFGAADFVSWYDGHPDWRRDWPLEAREIAVLGVGNVALDVARVLAKHAADLLPTEIPDNVAAGLAKSPVTDVHVFGRRGPAQVKFSPLELRELGKQNDVDVIVSPQDFEFDEGSQTALSASNQQRQVVKALTAYASAEEHHATRRIHIHLFEAPEAILGDENENVRAIVTRRQKLTGDGTVVGTDQLTETPVQAVYRAVGYYGTAVPGVPFDQERGVIPNVEGRTDIPGLYCTGWVKRGPVGLIGSTKSDAAQTIANLLADFSDGRLPGAEPTASDIFAHLDAAGVNYTTWQGWELLDAYERQLGEAEGRARKKVVSRAAMLAISHGQTDDLPDLIGDAPADMRG